jgi:hypothetical protein
MAVAALAAAYGGALALLSRDDVEAVLRSRIEAVLRAQLGELSLGEQVRVDPLFRVTFGPLTVAGVRPEDPPLLRVERLEVRPRLGSILMGRAEPASIRLLGARAELPDRAQALRDVVDRLRTAPSRRASGGPPAPALAAQPDARDGESAPIRVANLTFAFHLSGHRVEVGPAQLSILRARDSGTERTTADLRLPGRGRCRLDLRRDASGWRGDLRLEGIGPEVLPAGLGGLPVTWVGGRLALSIEAAGAPDLSRAEGSARVAAEDLLIGGEMIAPEPVGPASAKLEATVAWDGVERRIAARDGRLDLPGAPGLAFHGETRLGPGIPFSLRVIAAGVDYRLAVGALPSSLQPPPATPRPAGTLDAELSLSGPLLAPGAWSVGARLDLSRLREAARRAPPVALREPFVHHPAAAGGRSPAIRVGPDNPDFVPIAELPVHVVRAVTASEDGGFFGHSGFDFEELRNALAQGAEAGRVVRGGSTITQQLAKNLFLSREKTFARKVREAAATVALEATIPKARLLEIYLNIAEWGPGLWGIGPAARHWFGKDARALTPKEAAFLATVIPNPVRYHFMWARGALTDGWEQRVRELLFKMTEQRALSEDGLVAALDQPLVFAGPVVAQPASAP